MKLLLFLIGELALVTASTIWKRQAASSTGCADRDNTVTICSPEPQDIWHNGTYHEITWKYNNAIYARYDTLDLYLLDFQHNEYRTLKKWTGLQRTKGLLIQAVDDSWFPSPAPNNSPDRVYTLYLYLLASNITLERELRKLTLRESFYPAPQTLTLIRKLFFS
ncbi:uncharacterized protein BYT42DRAFT_272296 [Radiomyces spectabilis]|uniref:uncharacterized protein n=1 Tax=Radiomyces spectabilis TaxID=64574 RepID=UPI002220A758|nr:uncharacterized protein BYT42DRAFT_272296 [Radiomyces spectabilis]KAI8384729.1 hypothetical protein BYT42DRAFT_272296 [Radiomyces spectabilis]